MRMESDIEEKVKKLEEDAMVEATLGIMMKVNDSSYNGSFMC